MTSRIEKTTPWKIKCIGESTNMSMSCTRVQIFGTTSSICASSPLNFLLPSKRYQSHCHSRPLSSSKPLLAASSNFHLQALPVLVPLLPLSTKTKIYKAQRIVLSLIDKLELEGYNFLSVDNVAALFDTLLKKVIQRNSMTYSVCNFSFVGCFDLLFHSRILEWTWGNCSMWAFVLCRLLQRGEYTLNSYWTEIMHEDWSLFQHNQKCMQHNQMQQAKRSLTNQETISLANEVHQNHWSNILLPLCNIIFHDW